MKFLFTLLLLYASTFSMSFKQLSKYPQSLEKDLFLYLYLRQDNISYENAKEAFSQVNKVNAKILNVWAKHSKDEGDKQKLKCKKQSELSKIHNAKCLATAFSIPRLFAYIDDKQAILDVYHKLSSSDEYKDKSKIALILSKKDFPKVLLEENNQKAFLDIFNSVSYKIRKKYFNTPLNAKIISSLSKHKYRFKSMLQNAITTTELKILQKSLLNSPITIELSHKSNFFMGLNALKFHNKELANYYLLKSLQLSKNIDDKNKALFWLYKTNKKSSYLGELAKSPYSGFYNILALSTMGMMPSVTHDIKTDERIKQPLFNSSHPFEYRRYMKKYTSLVPDKRLLHKDTLPIIIKQYNKFFNFKKNFFFIPDYITKLKVPVEKKALLLAIARQESLFVPSAISSSYALGVMQILPFVVEEIASRAKYKYNIWDMFDPKQSVKFSSFHLKGLKRHLKHPLFMSYGYSNGMGFTKRLLKREYFKSGNDFEPYMSMELIPNNQARKYGKKVLGNYIIYRHLLGKSVNINKLISSARRSII